MCVVLIFRTFIIYVQCRTVVRSFPEH
jgi:hypothetical protein